MGAPLLMAAALPIFAVSFLVLGPELKEYTVFRLDDVLRVDHRGVAFQRLAWSEAAALESDGRQLTARTNKGKSIVLLDLSDGSRDWAHSVAELSSGLRVNAPTG